jgi:hypothetical protein
MHQLPPNAIDGDGFAMVPRRLWGLPVLWPKLLKVLWQGPFLVPDPQVTQVSVSDSPGPAHVHRPPWSEWFAQRPGDGETWRCWKHHLGKVFHHLFGIPILPICAWIVVVSLRAILATCHTCRWQERAYSPMLTNVSPYSWGPQDPQPAGFWPGVPPSKWLLLPELSG